MDIKVGQLLKQDIMISTPEGECEMFRPPNIVRLQRLEVHIECVLLQWQRCDSLC